MKLSKENPISYQDFLNQHPGNQTLPQYHELIVTCSKQHGLWNAQWLFSDLKCPDNNAKEEAEKWEYIFKGLIKAYSNFNIDKETLDALMLNDQGAFDLYNISYYAEAATHFTTLLSRVKFTIVMLLNKRMEKGYEEWSKEITSRIYTEYLPKNSVGRANAPIVTVGIIWGMLLIVIGKFLQGKR